MLWGGEGTPLDPQGEDSLEAFPPLPAPADGELQMTKYVTYYDRLFLAPPAEKSNPQGFFFGHFIDK